MVGQKLVSQNTTFDKSLEVVRQSLGSAPVVPADVLKRARLKSDAMRAMAPGPEQNMVEAEALLTKAISSHDKGSSTIQRLRELHLLRAEVRGSWVLNNFDGALADLNDVVEAEPALPSAYLEKAKVLRRMKKLEEAVQCLKIALEKGVASESDGLSEQQKTWIKRNIDDLEERLLSGDTGDKNADATDSGDGSGRWKVAKIVGVSFDTCVYYLENQPPAEPHPYPNDAWHVSIRFGKDSRDYTPVSTAMEWEKGRLSLLVKTYPDGLVSKKFAALQPFSVSQAVAWATVTVPKLTLALPHLKDGVQVSKDETPAVTHIGVVVGGTGIVPGYQILKELENSQGAFDASVKATLVYASRRPRDVLLLDELRALEASSTGRIVVWHTLTDHTDDNGVSDDAASIAFSQGLSSLPCRHFNFASSFKPFKLKHGPLRVTPGSEAGLRGRPTAAMFSAVLPPPGPGVRVVVSGPPAMWEDVKQMLVSLGHDEANLVELHSLSAEQMEQDQSKAPSIKPAVLSKTAPASDVASRIEAVRTVCSDPDALRLKAAAAIEIPTATADGDSWAKSGAQKRSWNQDSAWTSSKWQASVGGWSASSWKSSGW